MRLWGSFSLIAANPQWLGLPGEGALSNFALLIAAYIPAGVSTGAMVSWGIGYLRQPRLLASVSGLVCIVGLWGARYRVSDLDVSQHALVTHPDLAAAAWIRENAPRDARFLINSFSAYGDTSIVGPDGGWWLPILTGRQSTVPTLDYSSEAGPTPDYQEWINALSREVLDKGIAQPEVLAELSARAVTYVYIGQLQGRVNYDGPSVLRPADLLGSSHFRPVYHQDRVWVFQVVQ